MSTVLAVRKRPQKKVKFQPRPAIEPTQLYNRPETALITNTSNNTVIRAFENGFLQGYRIGNRVRHSGQHILDWLESGGKTGYCKYPQDEEEREAGGRTAK